MHGSAGAFGNTATAHDSIARFATIIAGCLEGQIVVVSFSIWKEAKRGDGVE
jgi:hypothetical protein